VILLGPSWVVRSGQQLPAGYWERYAEETAARIREQVAQALCTCAGEQPITVKDGRCTRCFGRAGDEA
jgi:hypothetical protein